MKQVWTARRSGQTPTGHGNAREQAVGHRPLAYIARIMQIQSGTPPAPGQPNELLGASLMDSAVKLRASHPAVPAMDILQLVLQGQRGQNLYFGDVPPLSPFGLLVVEAFDRGMSVDEWIALSHSSHVGVKAALDLVWRTDIWPAFKKCFDLS